MTQRIGDRDGGSLRDTKKIELFDTSGVDHRLKIRDEGVQREIRHFPVGQTIASLVVADQAIAPGQLTEPVAPNRTPPVELEVVEPVGSFDEGEALSDRGPCEAHTVGSGAVADHLRRKVAGSSVRSSGRPDMSTADMNRERAGYGPTEKLVVSVPSVLPGLCHA